MSGAGPIVWGYRELPEVGILGSRLEISGPTMGILFKRSGRYNDRCLVLLPELGLLWIHDMWVHDPDEEEP